jgi:ribose transport system substrate-binding protein
MPMPLRHRIARLALACLLPMAAFAAPMTFVMVPKGVHPYYEPCYEGFQAAASYFGVNVERVDPQRFELPLQVKIIDDLIARHVDGIAISALDDAGLVPVIARASRAGIKVVTFDSAALSSAELGYMGTNNKQAGFEAGRRMALLMKGTGKVIVLQGGLAALNLSLRTRGFKEAIAHYGPRIKVLEVVDVKGDLAIAAQKTEAILDSHPDLTAIFAVSAEGAPAAASVLKARNLSGKVLLGGFDDLKETLAGIREGSIAFCLVQNTFKMGWLAVQSLVDAENGKRLAKITDTPALIVTAANVDTYMNEMKQELMK